mgnify:CR=1 FL=1
MLQYITLNASFTERFKKENNIKLLKILVLINVLLKTDKKTLSLAK